MTGDPPSDSGAFQVTLALVFVTSETTNGPVGADGGTEGEENTSHSLLATQPTSIPLVGTPRKRGKKNLFFGGKQNTGIYMILTHLRGGKLHLRLCKTWTLEIPWPNR